MKQKYVIHFDQVHKTYTSDFRRKPTQALNRVSFAVEKGEIFGIIGANGAGKSTSIKILMGFTTCSTGKVSLNNRSPRSHTAHQGVGYLPENPCLYDNLTVTEHLQFAAKVLKLNPREATTEIESILRRIELHKVAKVPIRKFSKGMTQRAALAYALIGSPKILILDEPMSGLDPLGRQIVLDIIQEQQQEGRTVLFCSHILTDVERICSKIAIMNQGRLVATLTPDQLNASNETTDPTGHSPLESYFLKTITHPNL